MTIPPIGLSRFVKILDANNDGKVTAGEAAVVAKRAEAALRRRKVGSAVRKGNALDAAVDLDGDKILSHDELRHARASLAAIWHVTSNMAPSQVLARPARPRLDRPPRNLSKLKTPDEARITYGRMLTEDGVPGAGKHLMVDAGGASRGLPAYMKHVVARGQIEALPFMISLAARKVRGAKKAVEDLLGSRALRAGGKTYRSVADLRKNVVGNARGMAALRRTDAWLVGLATMSVGDPPKPEVVAARAMAMRALSTMRYPAQQAPEVLATALRSDNPALRKWALSGITQGNGDALKLDTARLAKVAVGVKGGSEALAAAAMAAVKKDIASTAGTQPALLRLIAQHGKAAGKKFLDQIVIGKGDAKLRRAAAGALLGPKPNTAAVKRLLARLDPTDAVDKEVGKAIIESVAASRRSAKRAAAMAEIAKDQRWVAIANAAKTGKSPGQAVVADSPLRQQIERLAAGGDVAALSRAVLGAKEPRRSQLVRHVFALAGSSKEEKIAQLARSVMRGAVTAGKPGEALSRLWSADNKSRGAEDTRRGMVAAAGHVLKSGKLPAAAKAALADFITNAVGTSKSVTGRWRKAALNGLAAHFKTDDDARQRAMATLKALNDANSLRGASRKHEVLATALTRSGHRDAQYVAATFRLSRVKVMGDAMATSLANNAAGYSKLAQQHYLLDYYRKRGMLKNNDWENARFRDAHQRFDARRNAANTVGRKLADTYVQYLLRPEVAESLRHVRPEHLGAAINPGLKSLLKLRGRLAFSPPALQAYRRLQTALQTDMVKHRRNVEANKVVAPVAHPHLLMVTDMKKAGLYESGRHVAGLEKKKGGWDPLGIYDLHGAAVAAAKTSWARTGSVPVFAAAANMMQIAAQPKMGKGLVQTLKDQSARTLIALEHSGHHTSRTSAMFRRLGALAATFEGYFAFGSTKKAWEKGGEIAFYATEIAEWAARTQQGAKWVGKLTRFGEANQGAARSLARITGRGLSGTALPILGGALASGVAFYDMGKAIGKGDYHEAGSRSAEGAGWMLLAIGTAAPGAGVPLQVVGGVLIIGSYAYDTFFKPNEGVRLAHRLGYGRKPEDGNGGGGH